MFKGKNQVDDKIAWGLGEGFHSSWMSDNCSKKITLKGTIEKSSILLTQYWHNEQFFSTTFWMR